MKGWWVSADMLQLVYRAAQSREPENFPLFASWLRRRAWRREWCAWLKGFFHG
jgi:hypothetical protein